MKKVHFIWKHTNTKHETCSNYKSPDHEGKGVEDTSKEL